MQCQASYPGWIESRVRFEFEKIAGAISKAGRNKELQEFHLQNYDNAFKS